MTTPLLTTKLYVPSLCFNFLSRPRLLDRLNEGLARKRILVSAPAGSGKTTLVAEWLQDINLVTAWLSLDLDDNDPLRFLTYLIAALQRIERGLGQTVQQALGGGQPQQPQLVALMTMLINEISTLVDKDFVLVLDDYHFIENQAVHDAVAFLLEHLPPQMRVVITTRADPPLPLWRWRARGQLTELRTADLRFTPEEAATFLNNLMGLNLSAEQLAALEKRSEGWVAGVQLAALSMQGRSDKAGFIQAFSGSHAYIADYLVEEVLRRQPEPIQTFLLHTSILDRLSAPLCDAVLGKEGSKPDDASSLVAQPSAAILEQLERANLFVVPLDDERRWYRYHHLFADVLRARLLHCLPSEEQRSGVAELHQRASVWYERHGLVSEAIQHALLAQDIEHAADLVGHAWWETWTRGALSTLLQWCGALPPQALQARPRLQIMYGWALMTGGRRDAAEAQLQEAEGVLRQLPPGAETDDLFGWATALRAVLVARQGDVEGAIALGQQALGLLTPDDVLMRGGVNNALGMAYRLRGAMPEARQAYAEASRDALATGNYYLAFTSMRHGAWATMIGGRLHKAADIYRQALTIATERGGQLPAAGWIHAGYADILYQWNELDAATQHAETGTELGLRGNILDIPVYACSTLAKIKQARGDREGALAAIEEAVRSARRAGASFLLEWAEAREASLYLQQGRLDLVAHWAHDHPCPVEAPKRYQDEVEGLVWARLWLARGKHDQSLAVLERLLASAEGAGRRGSAIEVMALQALALSRSRWLERARRVLGQALTLAEPEGYVRIFADEGIAMSALVRANSYPGVTPSYLARLLADFPDLAERTSAASISNFKSASQNLLEPLSDREQELLRLLATKLSNQEIAARLGISLPTVKTHLRHIYDKLESHTRAEAVERAKELGLL